MPAKKIERNMIKLNENLILITGSGGVLGSAIRNIAKENGLENNILCPNRAELDLLDEISTKAYLVKHKPTLVIHLASLVYGLAGNMANQMQSLVNNTMINHVLFKSIYDLQKNKQINISKIFFAGTVASYPFPYQNMPLLEEDFFQGNPHFGEFGYAMAKKHAYAYLELLQKELNIDYVYGILTNLYGENDKFDIKYGHVIPSLIAKAHHASLTDSTLEVWGDGSATRDFMYSKDAAQAILFLLNHSFNGLINISSFEEITIKNLALILTDVAKIKKIKFLSDKPTGIPLRLVNNQKLLDLGFNLQYSLREGLSNTYNWYTSHLTMIRI